MKTLTISAWLCLSVVDLVAQQQPIRECNLTVESTGDDPAIVRLTVMNLREASVVVDRMTPENSYAISLLAQDGSEPPRTSFGERLRKNFEAGGSVLFRELLPGQVLSQEWDLRDIWNLTQGGYHLKVSRLVDIGGEAVRLHAAMLLTIPPGYVSDKGCTVDAKARREPNGKRAALVEGAVPTGEPTELKTVLALELPRSKTAAEHRLVTTLADITIAAGVPGGIALLERDSADLVCLEGAKTIKEAIEEIQVTRPELSLDRISPILNLIDSRISDLLETQIIRIEIPHPATELDLAVESIFSSPEMRERAVALGLDDQTQRSSERRPRDHRREIMYLSERPLLLNNVTAREVLNAITQRWGSGIWIYSESKQSERRQFQIRFNLGVHSLKPSN